ncbi:MAG: hypothetical protein ACRC0V_11920 [Fusobacteriaceae bacterium]
MNYIKNETNYIFSHIILKNNFLQHKKELMAMLFMSEDKKIEELLQNSWNHSYKIAKQSKDTSSIIKEDFNHEIKKGKINDNLIYWVLTLPTPKYITDCKYVGMLYNHDTDKGQYITLEKSYKINTFGGLKGIFNKIMGKSKKDDVESYVLCGWDAEAHFNYGSAMPQNVEEFVDLMKGITR